MNVDPNGKPQLTPSQGLDASARRLGVSGRTFDRMKRNGCETIGTSVTARALFALFLTCTLWSQPSRGLAQAPQYTITILGPDFAYGVNASGEAAGFTGAANSVALVWQGATPTVLGTIGGQTNVAYSINTSGQIAGYASNSTGAINAVVWNGTTPTILSSLGVGSMAFAINASGQVTGNSVPSSNVEDAVVWNGTTPTILSSVGGTQSSGYAINASGQVAGSSYTTGNVLSDAVVWNGATATILSSLGGSGGSVAYGINDSGQTVGYSNTSGNASTDAVEWNGTTPTVLGSLGGAYSYAYAINNSGEVVGESYLAGNTTEDPFLYTNGKMYDLNSLITPGAGISNLFIYYAGNSLNDSGQIVASGVINGQTDALLLTPQVVPEPSSAVLLSLGGGALLGVRRRKNGGRSE
jgi:probable HAF family extracellular repeat protein